MITRAEIDAALAHGTWRNLESIAACIVKDAEKAANSTIGMNPILGGGTRLMLAMKHRISHDIDLFIRDPQWLGYLSPRLNDSVEEKIHDYEENNDSLKLKFKDGEIDFIAGSSLLNLSGKKTRDCIFELEHPAEILAKKLFYRGWAFTARDLFDWRLLEDCNLLEDSHVQSIARVLDGKSSVKMDLIENSLNALKQSALQERRWDEIKTPFSLDYKESIEWAQSRLEQFRNFKATRQQEQQNAAPAPEKPLVNETLRRAISGKGLLSALADRQAYKLAKAPTRPALTQEQQAALRDRLGSQARSADARQRPDPDTDPGL